MAPAMLIRLTSHLILRMTGWRLEGEPPTEPHVVLLAVPHTSNWDGLYMVCMASIGRLPIRWMGKRSLFRGAKGWFMRRLGGLPVDREAPGGLVAQMVEAFAARERMALVIPPEGTRSRRDTWKSGFYHIARGANVPVTLTFLDYARKRGGFGPTFHLTGDVAADMDKIRAFYADVTARYPERMSPVRLAEEAAARTEASDVTGRGATSSG